MHTNLFLTHLAPNYSAYALKRLVFANGGPAKGPAESAPAAVPDAKVEQQKKVAEQLKALKETINTSEDNVKTIAAAIDMGSQEAEVKQAILLYSLSKHAKALPGDKQEIIDKIKDAIVADKLPMKDIMFYGGTDGSRFLLRKVLIKGEGWHTGKAQAFDQLKALGDRLFPASARTLRDDNIAIIDAYIDAHGRAAKNEVVKANQDKFLPGGALFNLALALQRAKHAQEVLSNKKVPFDATTQEVFLELGSAKGADDNRKSGLWAVGKVKEEPKVEPKVEEPKVEKPKAEEPKVEKLPRNPDAEKTWVEGMVDRDYKIFVQAYQNMTDRVDYYGPGKEQNVFNRRPIMDIKTSALLSVAMGYGVEYGKERDTAKQINRFKVRGVYLKETGIDGERIFLQAMEEDLRNYYKKEIEKNGIVIRTPDAKELAERDAFTKDFEKYFEERLKEFEAKASTDLKGKTLNNAMYSGPLFSVTKDPLWSTLVDVRRGPDVGGKPQFEYYIRGTKKDRAAVTAFMKDIALQQYDTEHKFVVLGTPKAVEAPAVAPAAPTVETPAPAPTPAVETPAPAPTVEPTPAAEPVPTPARSALEERL